MFSVMRAALLAETATQLFTEAAPAVTLTQRDLLAFATIEGARASGLDHEIGSLTPGKAADIVVLDLRQPGIASAVDPVAAVVDQGHPGAVIDVLVAGRYVKKSGRMVDRALVEKTVAAAERSRDRLLARQRQLHPQER
jgi:cytosine/adenosine deaminase-related metal-dependent hydrolase